MINIKKIILSLFAVFCCFSIVSAQDTTGNVENLSGSIVNTANTDGRNTIVLGQSVTASERDLDYRLDSGILATVMISNPAIIFSDVVPDPNAVSDKTTVDVSIKVETKVSNIREVGYRIKYNAPPAESDTYTRVYYNANADSSGDQIVTATATISGLVPGNNYIQWYAQNGIDADGNTNTYLIKVEGVGRQVTILQPGSASSKKPTIQASVVSQDDVSFSSNVVVYIFEGNVIGSSSSYKYKRTGDQLVNGDPIFNAGTGKIDYKYDGAGTELLQDGKQYTLAIEATDNGGNYFYASASFKISSEEIADLLPYPSPYNPKKGDMTIRFVIADQASVTINIYDRSGRLVSQVLDSVTKPSGENKVTWKGKSYAGDNLANGVYICEIITKSGGTENRRYKSFAILRK